MMRLDLFLKVSRLVPRRTLANEMCDAGAVKVNGTRAKASRDVAVGDVIAIRRRGRLTECRVKSVPQAKQVSKAQASEIFEILNDAAVGEDDNLI